MKRNLFIVLAVFVLLILIFAAGSRIQGNSILQKAVARYEKEAGPIVPQSYSPPSPTAESRMQDNIAVWIKAGAELVYETAKDRGFLDELMHNDYHSWNATDKSALQELLTRNDLALQVLQKSTACRNSSFELEYNAGLNMQLPRYLQIMHAQKLIGCKARLLLSEGKLPEALRLIAAEERMAAALQHDPVLIGGLIGLVVEKDYHEMVHAVLPLSDQNVQKELMIQMQHFKTMAIPASRFLAAEGAAFYHTLSYQAFSTSIMHVDASVALPTMHRFFKRYVIANSLELYTDYVTLSKRPYQTIDGSQWTPDGYVKRELHKGSVPNISSVVERFQSTEAARILANAAIELCLKRHTEGRYPQNLGSLTSPYTGEQATYAVHSDGSATLSFPKDNAFWDSTHAKAEPWLRKPRFIWNLPAGKTS